MLPPDEWDNLPDGASFSLRLSGDTGDCDGMAFVFLDGSQIDIWAHDELVAGRSMTLSVPHRYRVSLQISFVGASSNVTVDAGPSAGGNPLGTPYHESTTGQKNDSDSAEFALNTAI